MGTYTYYVTCHSFLTHR